VTFPLVIIAGADQALFDTLSAASANAFAPGGARILKPAPHGLTAAHAADLLAAARVRLKTLPETVPVNIIVLAVTSQDEDDAPFRQAFYPFALYRRVDAPDYSQARSTNVRNKIRNAFVGQLKSEAIESRGRADVVKGVVSKANMSPLILPVRNFRSVHLEPMLAAVFDGIATHPNPGQLLRSEEQRFVTRVPYARPPGGQRRCFCDGRHYFKSPGRHQHGYYQNSKDGAHGTTCLLNARSRLGGAIAHAFHFDCDPITGLDASYPNCHDALHPPKAKHVNIAPSDAVIGS
jgi:hypothetical protein